MQLKISNFTKVKNTSIHINAITVIARENNTGKSTSERFYEEDKSKEHVN